MGDWARAEEFARLQHGCVTRHQLAEADFDTRAVHYAIRSGRLVHLIPRAYRLRSAVETPVQLAHAAAMTIGVELLISHQSAGVLHHLHGCGTRLELPIHVTVPRGVRYRLPESFVVHQSRSSPALIIPRGALLLTGIARTITDLAGSLTELQLEALLDKAHLKFRDLEEWLRDELAIDRRFDGRDTLEHLLAIRDGLRVESPFETRIRRALRGSTAGPHRTQYRVHDSNGFITRVDFAWPQQRVAVLGDSYQWHSSRTQFDLDASQRSRLAALDWLCIPVTWATLDDAGWQISLRQALDRRLPQHSLWVPGPERLECSTVTPLRTQ